MILCNQSGDNLDTHRSQMKNISKFQNPFGLAKLTPTLARQGAQQPPSPRVEGVQCALLHSPVLLSSPRSWLWKGKWSSPLQNHASLCQAIHLLRCLVWEWAGPPSCVTRREENSKTGQDEKTVPLRTARRQAIPNRGFCCLSHDMKMPGVGKRSQKYSHGKNAQSGMPADCLNFSSPYPIWCFSISPSFPPSFEFIYFSLTCCIFNKFTHSKPSVWLLMT